MLDFSLDNGGQLSPLLFPPLPPVYGNWWEISHARRNTALFQNHLALDKSPPAASPWLIPLAPDLTVCNLSLPPMASSKEGSKSGTAARVTGTQAFFRDYCGRPTRKWWARPLIQEHHCFVSPGGRLGQCPNCFDERADQLFEINDHPAAKLSPRPQEQPEPGPYPASEPCITGSGSYPDRCREPGLPVP